MLPKHPFSTSAVIQVFHEDHITFITEGMGLLEVKVLTSVVDVVVKSCNFKTLFFVVLRPLLFPRESTLQQLSREDARPLR